VEEPSEEFKNQIIETVNQQLMHKSIQKIAQNSRRGFLISPLDYTFLSNSDKTIVSL
jgi:hypothetical protein